ncbi:protein O-mannosyl-transferase family [Sandaracinus amylolyticus]|uniref:protein O-mannosyl-transferase family n=1 Tax=Sandaracinus amylolyticus TaxID=927083 RepID=UPI001F31B2D2|nr:DUF2723 domain-containing protein [Sandaracinus amylolyticus]UJR80531.1 Hypothetical protein I5071_25780 [Sandaracinus amylolyticus]
MIARPSTLVALAGLVVLVLCTGASPGLYDAGGIVAGATALAATHPPGQPLHAIVAHAATYLPFGPLTFRIALASAITEVLAAWFVGRIAFAIAHDSPDDEPRAELAATVATCAALLAPPLLRQATRAEVYGLAAALSLASIHALVRWWKHDPHALSRAALFAGLAAAVHPPHAFAAVLTGAALLPAMLRARRVRPRAIAHAALAFVLGATPYVLLPLRDAAGAPQWGDASTWSDFVRYATGAAYHRNLGAGSIGTAELALGVLAYVATILGPALLLLAIGLVVTRRAQGPTRAPLLVALVLTLVPGLLQPLDARIPDHLAYLAPFTGLALALTAAALASAPLPRTARAGALAVVALSPTTILDAPASACIDAPILETLAFELTDAPPPRALALVQSDLATMSWRAARATELARPDVAVLPLGTIHEPWQWRPLATHPCFTTPPVAHDLPTSLARGRGCTTVLSEKRDPALRAIALLGSYLSEDAPISRPFTERLDAALARELAISPPGLHDELAAQARNQLLNRAQRLVESGRSDAGLHLAGATLPFVAASLRAPLERAQGTRPLRPPVPVAIDPDALFDASREDAIRVAAELLFRTGDPVAAEALLLDQLDRGDPRALLQIGHHAAAAGDRATAQRALDTFLATAPALAPEASSLEQALAP